MSEIFRKGNTTPKAKQVGTLERAIAVPQIVGDPKDFLIVAGVAGTSMDTVSMCGMQASNFAFAAAMGSAVAMGLGLALAQPEKKVLVITGDGELLMNVGSLATVAMINPPNLSILCVDNGHYWETGGQTSHTALVTDLAAMAAGAGIPAVTTVTQESEFSQAAALLRSDGNSSFVLLKVKPGEPPRARRAAEPGFIKTRFRMALAEEQG